MNRNGNDRRRESELIVITKAKELSRYVFQVTQHAPKKFRFSLVSKMQTLSLEVIECIYQANETYVDLKLLQDLEHSLQATTLDGVDLEEFYFRKNKRLQLRMARATLYEERVSRRFDHAFAAITKLKELDHMVVLSREMLCIMPKQHELIAKHIWDVRNLLGAWIKSDRKRYKY